MIAEAEARGDSAERIFPNGGQNFCDELLKNAVKKRWYEYVLSILNCIEISFAEVFPIVVLGTYIFIPGRRRSRARRYNWHRRRRFADTFFGGADRQRVGYFYEQVCFYEKTVYRTFDFYCACPVHCRNYRSCILWCVWRRVHCYEHKLGCFMDNHNGGCRTWKRIVVCVGKAQQCKAIRGLQRKKPFFFKNHFLFF